MDAICVTRLSKSFGKLQAVEDLSFTVGQGELFALLGVNGAGKTTTIKMLTGLLRPTAGDASIMGHSISLSSEAAKRVTGISPQETAVAPQLTVRENLEFMAGLYGFSKKEAAREAGLCMATFRLLEKEHAKAHTLSGGMKRRLSVAMGLISKPRVLFLDEPTLGLDVLSRRELWDTLAGLKGSTTIVLTTHYLEEAVALSDRIGIMSGGRMVAIGTADELKEKTGKATFEDAFVQLVTKEENQ